MQVLFLKKNWKILYLFPYFFITFYGKYYFYHSAYWFFSFFSLAPFVPTRNRDLERVAKIAWLQENETFLEIWCWTAKVSIFIAKFYPNNTIVGIEFSPFLYILSKIKAFFSWQKNIKILYGNALKLDFSQYDILYIFWTPSSLKEKIIPKFMKEAKENSKLLSYCFSFENSWLNEKKYKENENELSIFEYKK